MRIFRIFFPLVWIFIQLSKWLIFFPPVVMFFSPSNKSNSGLGLTSVRNIRVLPQSQVRHMLESWRTGKIYFYRRVCVCASDLSQAIQHTHKGGRTLQFWSLMQDCPLTQWRELGFTVFVIDQGWDLGESKEEEQTWLDSLDRNLIWLLYSKKKRWSMRWEF
jgi:hypothetical protein